MTTFDVCPAFRQRAGTLLLGAFALASCSDEPTPTGPGEDQPVITTAVIGQSGGRVNGPSGAFELVFPASAFPGATEVTISHLNDGPADVRVVPKTMLDFTFKSDRLNRTVILTIKYDPSKVPASMGENSLRLAKLTPGGWELAGNLQFNGTVDTVANTVTGAIIDPGVYAVRSLPVDRILLFGAAVNGDLYIGQTASIGVLMYRAINDVAIDDTPTRPIAWTSSAPTTISVDATGKLTALAPGSATITAKVEGISATSAINVLARPVANWTGATDWTTYQGNVRHNGFINVTADPVVFRERWVKTPDAAVQSFHQATASGNRVFLVTEDGKRQVFALSATDGVTQWQKDLGGQFSTQATYDNGSLYLTAGGLETHLYAFDASNGSERFRVPFQGQYPGMRAPIVIGSTVVAAINRGGISEVHGYNSVSGAQVFRKSELGPGFWTPAAHDGLIWTTSGGVSTINPADGTLVQQVHDLRVQANSTPIIGSSNNLLTQALFRLVSVDLATKRVIWDQRAENDIPPVAGSGVVYSADAGSIMARSETSGALLWSWKPAAPFTTLRSTALTSNLLMVSISTGSPSEGMTVAIDLASHRAVWSYPMTGALSINGDGTLYIVQLNKVAAIAFR
jgi:PQQ-like domain/Bacterial Ig-like domain (group 2)